MCVIPVKKIFCALYVVSYASVRHVLWVLNETWNMELKQKIKAYTKKKTTLDLELQEPS